MAKWRRSISDEFFDPDLVDLDAHYEELPEELDPYIFGFYGVGPCVMAILERDFSEAAQDKEFDLWETEVPCRLFMKCSYRFYDEYIIVNVPPEEGDDWSNYHEPDRW